VGGGIQNVLSLSNSDASNGISSFPNIPTVGNHISNFKNKPTNNYGIFEVQASGIANNLIPTLLSNLVNRINDSSNHSCDISSILGSFTSGNVQSGTTSCFDLLGNLGNFTNDGLDSNGDGKVGFAVIIK